MVRVEADINESNTGLFKEVSASKVALYPSLMLPTLPTVPQPAAIRFGPQRPANQADIHIRSAAEAKIREADRLECEAWNAIKWAGGPAMTSPGEPQAEPTIGKAINGGYDLLEAKCNRCDRVSLVPLRSLKHPPETPVWKLEAALYCEPCSEGRHYSRRQRAHILGLTYDRPEPEQPKMPARKSGRKP